MSLPAVLAQRYLLLDKLGEGGMGRVFRALDNNSGKEVAIKILRGDLCKRRRSRRRFAREAQYARMLNHPGIVRVYDYGEEPRPYLVMELLNGVSLRRYIRTHKCGILEILELTAQVCEALEHAHSHGVIHRDLKPDNISVDGEGQIKILDFGLARLVNTYLSALTKSGTALGTCSYMAPEQAAGKEADERSDLYSLGVILYEFICGITPFSADDPAQILYMQVHQQPERPRDINPEIPAEVEGLILWILNKNPLHRPQTAGQLLRKIDAIADYLQKAHILDSPASNKPSLLLPEEKPLRIAVNVSPPQHNIYGTGAPQTGNNQLSERTPTAQPFQQYNEQLLPQTEELRTATPVLGSQQQLTEAPEPRFIPSASAPKFLPDDVSDGQPASAPPEPRHRLTNYSPMPTSPYQRNEALVPTPRVDVGVPSAAPQFPVTDAQRPDSKRRPQASDNRVTDYGERRHLLTRASLPVGLLDIADDTPKLTSGENSLLPFDFPQVAFDFHTPVAQTANNELRPPAPPVYATSSPREPKAYCNSSNNSMFPNTTGKAPFMDAPRKSDLLQDNYNDDRTISRNPERVNACPQRSGIVQNGIPNLPEHSPNDVTTTAAEPKEADTTPYPYRLPPEALALRTRVSCTVTALSMHLDKLFTLFRDLPSSILTEAISEVLSYFDDSIKCYNGKIIDISQSDTTALFTGQHQGMRAAQTAKVMRRQIELVKLAHGLSGSTSLTAGIFSDDVEVYHDQTLAPQALQELFARATRLEQIARTTANETIISGESLEPEMQFEPLRSIYVKGREIPVYLYRIIALP